jgi:hypothetical protein
MNINTRPAWLRGFAIVLCTLGSGVGAARAQSSVVQLNVTADSSLIQCQAQNARFIIGAPPLFAWQCVGAAAAFRCRLNSIGVYAPDTKFVTVSCVGLSEDPPGAGADLLFAGGYESP